MPRLKKIRTQDNGVKGPSLDKHSKHSGIYPMRYRTYRFDEVGIRRLWRRKYAAFWDSLGVVYTSINDGRHGKEYRTDIGSSNGISVRLRCLKSLGGFSHLPKYSRTLEYILDRVPERIVCDKTRFVAKWGQETGLIKSKERALRDSQVSIDALKTLSTLYQVRLDFKKARKLLNQALKINPHDVTALESMAVMDIDEDKSIENIIVQYEKLSSLEPKNKKYLGMLATFCLNNDDEKGVSYANKFLLINPEEVTVRIELAEYYFRNVQFSQAKAIIREIGKIEGEGELMQFSQEQLDYIEQYEHDPNFRKKEKAKAKLQTLWWFIKFIFLPLTGILVLIYRLVRAFLD